MKRKVAQWLIGGMLTLLSVLTLLLLFQTQIFSTLIIDSLNEYVLRNSGLSIRGSIQGGLMRKSLSVNDLLISTRYSDEPIVAGNSVSVSGWSWDWSNRELSLHRVSIDSFRILTQNMPLINKSSNGTSNKMATIVQNLQIRHGEIEFISKDSLSMVSLSGIDANLWLIDGYLDSKIRESTAFVPAFFADTLTVEGLLGIDPQGGMTLENLEIAAGSQQLYLQLSMVDDHVMIDAKASNLSPHAISNLDLPPAFPELLIDYDVSLQKVGDSLHVSGQGILTLDAEEIPFTLHQFQNNPEGDLVDLTFGSDIENARIIANRTANGVQNFNLDLFRFDLTPFITHEGLTLSEPIGNISISGQQGSYVVGLIFESFHVNNIHFDTFESDFTYSRKDGLDIFTALVTQDNNYLNFSGQFSDDLVDLNGFIGFSDFSFLETLGIKNSISGEITSQLKIKGSADHPIITADLRPEELAYNEKLILTGDGKLVFGLNQGRLEGDIALLGSEGFLFGDTLRSYTFQGRISDAGYFIEDLHLQSKENLVSVSGSFADQKITLNKFNIIKGDNQLKIADTLNFIQNSFGRFELPPSVMTFNNGGLSVVGAFSQKDGFALDSHFELLDVGKLMDFFNLPVNFSGIASGAAQLSGSLSDPVIDAQFALNQGITIGYPSDSAYVDLRLTSSQVMSNRIEAFTAGGQLNLVGRLPWGYTVKGTDIPKTPQNFTIQTENYRLKDLKFETIAGQRITGRTNGTMSIRGTPGNTKMDIQLSLSEGTFDTLSFTKAYAELSYEGNLLSFDTLSMVSNWGYGNGTGYMPISLDLIASDRMAVASRDMGLEFEFNLNEMPFLSSYIPSIDAIEGDFIGHLNFSGPLSAPLRNGKMRGHNGRLNISVLGNPISNVHAEITVLDNTLTIDHFSGEMNFSEGSNLNTQGLVGLLATNVGNLIGVNPGETYAGDVTASGEIDLTTFFKPRFDIELKAEEVYYRSTDGSIEAIADGSLQFTGQDTLSVEAVIPVLRAGYYANFGSETSYDDRVSQVDGNMFTYRLNTQFASDLIISNDQLEAEFEGELWLLDFGDGVMRFTGTLTVQEGGKFYYLGNELTLITGEIIFDSVDFNPQINMEAEILIDNNRVSLILSGDLNEPELVINAESTELTQSDVLTYLTLNKTLVEVSFDESALDPVRTYGEILMEKQISKLGREYIGLDLVGVDIASDSTANARFQLGQRLSKNLMVTYEGAIQPTGGESDYDFGFEYQINKNVSVTSTINQNGTVELNGRLKFTY